MSADLRNWIAVFKAPVTLTRSFHELRLSYAEHMPWFANARNTNAANPTFNDIAGDQITIFGISD